MAQSAHGLDMEQGMTTGRNPRKLALGVGAGLAALLVAVLAWWWPAVSAPVTTLQARELVHSVVATATVQTRHRAQVGVQVAGRVLAVPVQEGDNIRQGQTLLSLDDSEARSVLMAAELAVQQAQFKLQQWRQVQAPTAFAAERQAQANLAQSQAQLARQQALFGQGFIAQAALDEASRTFQVAQAQARSAQAQRQAHEDQGLEQRLALSALALAQANAQAARTRLAYTVVQAPFDGQVINRNVEPGDMVQPGKTLLQLAPRGTCELVAQIDERNLSWLKPGQTATASADAYAGQRFSAVLSAIAPGVDAQRGSVQVKLRVPQPPEFLRQDMTVSVDIEVGRQSAALAVPLDAVRDADTPQPWVWRVSAQGRLARVPVSLGLRSGAWVQLTTGVAAGDRILAAAGGDWREGQRVRPLQP